MNRNLEVSIRIEMNETDAPLSVDAAEAIASGHYRVVIDGAKSLDIDAIENDSVNKIRAGDSRAGRHNRKLRSVQARSRNDIIRRVEVKNRRRIKHILRHSR